MNLSEEELKRIFKTDRYAELSNIELLTAAPGHATAKMTLHPHHLNALKTVQGGAIFTLADFTFAVACNSHGTMAVALERQHHLHEGRHHRHALGRGARDFQKFQGRHCTPSRSRTTPAIWWRNFRAGLPQEGQAAISCNLFCRSIRF
jgi:hypothetical protein